MPSKHKNPAVVYRPDPDLHARAKTAVAEVGSDMNTHVLGFLRWLVGDTDQFPQRPEPVDSTAKDQRSATKS